MCLLSNPNLADDTVPSYSTDDDWTPKLYGYQQEGANVLFLSFINPETMKVPLSFQKLAATKGNVEDGSVPTSTKIIFVVGGEGYSHHPNPWIWLTTKEKAEEMVFSTANSENAKREVVFG